MFESQGLFLRCKLSKVSPRGVSSLCTPPLPLSAGDRNPSPGAVCGPWQDRNFPELSRTLRSALHLSQCGACCPVNTGSKIWEQAMKEASISKSIYVARKSCFQIFTVSKGITSLFITIWSVFVTQAQ